MQHQPDPVANVHRTTVTAARSGEEDGVAFQSFQLADDITLAIAAYDVATLNE